MDLPEFFKEYPETAVAFSGGVDSAYLLYAAGRWGARVRAYYVKSAFQPQFEWEDAQKLAAALNVPMTTIPLEVLTEQNVADNPPDRCYYCKKRIFSALWEQVRADGFSVLLDGTNASDDAADRLGMRALRELKVLSPLRLCGLTKAEIRRRSREAGLFTWDKPAYACLATRIPAGRPIEERLLRRTEKAERYLFSLGFSDFRVRIEGEAARIQVRAQQLPLLLENREKILHYLKKEYQAVWLDLETRE